MSTEGFRTNAPKGFHVTFANGVTVSVQFGYGNYSANKEVPLATERESQGMKSPDAEVGTWDKDGKWIQHPGASEDGISGWRSPADVLDILNWAAAR